MVAQYLVRRHPADLLPADRPRHRAQGRGVQLSVAEPRPADDLRGCHLHAGRAQVQKDARLRGALMRWLRLALRARARGPAVAPASAGPLAHREVLPNGMVLLVAERPAIPIVVVRVYLRAGSVYDPADAGGLANLTADLLTRGTAKRTGPELDRAIEFVGGSLEGDAGQGRRDGRALRAEEGSGAGPRSPRRGAAPARPFPRRSSSAAARRSRRPSSARSRIRRPWRAGPWRSCSTRGTRTAGRSSGTVESVRRLTREQVVAFHRDNYRPDGASSPSWAT